MKRMAVVAGLVATLLAAAMPMQALANDTPGTNEIDFAMIMGAQFDAAKLGDAELADVQGSSSLLDIAGMIVRFVIDLYDAITNPSPLQPMLY